MKFLIAKKNTVNLEMGDVLITNEKLPITLKEMLSDNASEVICYTDNIEEAKSLVEEYGNERIYVVEAEGDCYGENEYFDSHSKFLGYRDGEYYLKEKGNDAVKVA